jgi:hypothetical protein
VTIKGICRLCGETAELRESHVFPKFIFKWMQSTGSRFFRATLNPNIRSQDGPKQHLLCDGCEARFSISEKYFSENIFHPYLKTGKVDYEYNSQLFFFLVSVSWRVLWQDFELCKKDKYPFLDLVTKAEQQWRFFLLNGLDPENFKDIHLLFTDITASKYQPVAKLNIYLNRAVDGTLVSNNSICAIYAKFSRFITFAAITPFDQSKWINTRVNINGGTFRGPQELRDGVIGEFIFDRARMIGQSSRHLTDKQNNIIGKEFMKNTAKNIKSDYSKAMFADMKATVDPFTLWPDTVGRNELCPCGSGKKFKKCHGMS